jgi:hypothetical protein
LRYVLDSALVIYQLDIHQLLEIALVPDPIVFGARRPILPDIALTSNAACEYGGIYQASVSLSRQSCDPSASFVPVGRGPGDAAGGAAGWTVLA